MTCEAQDIRRCAWRQTRKFVEEDEREGLLDAAVILEGDGFENEARGLRRFAEMVFSPPFRRPAAGQKTRRRF